MADDFAPDVVIGKIHGMEVRLSRADLEKMIRENPMPVLMPEIKKDGTLGKSPAAVALSQILSARRSQTSRENGKKGGRPPKSRRTAAYKKRAAWYKRWIAKKRGQQECPPTAGQTSPQL